MAPARYRIRDLSTVWYAGRRVSHHLRGLEIYM